jgi:hypothetical protein
MIRERMEVMRRIELLKQRWGAHGENLPPKAENVHFGVGSAA